MRSLATSYNKTSTVIIQQHQRHERQHQQKQIAPHNTDKTNTIQQTPKAPFTTTTNNNKNNHRQPPSISSANQKPVSIPGVPSPPQLAGAQPFDALELPIVGKIQPEDSPRVLPHQHPLPRDRRLGVLGDDIFALQNAKDRVYTHRSDISAPRFMIHHDQSIDFSEGTYIRHDVQDLDDVSWKSIPITQEQKNRHDFDS